MCDKENIRETFEEQFPLWVRAMIMYCKNTQIKLSALQEETASYTDDLPEGMSQAFHAYLSTLKNLLYGTRFQCVPLASSLASSLASPDFFVATWYDSVT